MSDKHVGMLDYKNVSFLLSPLLPPPHIFESEAWNLLGIAYLLCLICDDSVSFFNLLSP